MKKLLSIILSAVMLLTISVTTAMPVMAKEKNTLISPETTQKKIVIKVTLNGEDSHHTSYNPDETNSSVITFTYSGNGELEGWEFPNMVEGVDYIIISQDESSITIKVLDPSNEEIWANAIDSYPDETTKPAKKDTSSKSPKTGASTGLAIAGAGLAILIAAKKKD